MIPGPDIVCAFIICAHLDIWYTPAVYCNFTVLPISANFRSSNIKNPCFSAKLYTNFIFSVLKFVIISTWVLSIQINGPKLSAIYKKNDICLIVEDVVTYGDSILETVQVCVFQLKYR